MDVHAGVVGRDGRDSLSHRAGRSVEPGLVVDKDGLGRAWSKGVGAWRAVSLMPACTTAEARGQILSLPLPDDQQSGEPAEEKENVPTRQEEKQERCDGDQRKGGGSGSTEGWEVTW